MRRRSSLLHSLLQSLLILLPLFSSAQQQQQQQQHQQQVHWKTHLLRDTDARLYPHLTGRLATLLNATTTHACAEEVAMAYEAFITAHLTETLLPFESPFAKSQCPPPRSSATPPPPTNSTTTASASAPLGSSSSNSSTTTTTDLHEPQPPPVADLYKSPEDLRILYVISAHRDLGQVIRLIRALQDDDDKNVPPTSSSSTSSSSASAVHAYKSHFVVHIDGKVNPLPPDLLSFASTTPNVYLMKEGRVNVSWGGFSVVQATLNSISYGFYLGLPFDRVINLSGATYPLATPKQIRTTLAQHPLNEELMFIDTIPNVPSPRVWHYFVECDNQMHRIARLGLPRGVPLWTGSQWFIISRDFAHYMLTDQVFVAPYTAYAQHILIPDENFFATVLKNSPFCQGHVNRNYLEVTFDVWEDEKEEGERDQSKCLQPDPRICGRSPVLVGMGKVEEFLPVGGGGGGSGGGGCGSERGGGGGNSTWNATMTTTAVAADGAVGKDGQGNGKGVVWVSSNLFARKFDSEKSVEVLDEIDRLLALARQEEREREARGEGGSGGACDGNGGGGEKEEVVSSSSSVLRDHGIVVENIKW